MTGEDIVRMAKEAGLYGLVTLQNGFTDGAIVEVFDSTGVGSLTKFAQLVAAHEREECAKLADQLAELLEDHGHASHQGAVMSVAIKIRRRKP